METTGNKSPQQDQPAIEQELCLGCTAPNNPGAHFCTHCGAPLTSYAATAPFESLFAIGHVYRQAADQPKKLIVVVIWAIFAPIVLGSAAILATGAVADLNTLSALAFLLPTSLIIIWKTTKNYWANKHGHSPTEG